jgi:hypothetical protein
LAGFGTPADEPGLGVGAVTELTDYRITELDPAILIFGVGYVGKKKSSKTNVSIDFITAPR